MNNFNITLSLFICYTIQYFCQCVKNYLFFILYS
jgi:hypothetical protein